MPFRLFLTFACLLMSLGLSSANDEVPSTYKDGQLSFAITPTPKSIWYAITKAEASPHP